MEHTDTTSPTTPQPVPWAKLIAGAAALSAVGAAITTSVVPDYGTTGTVLVVCGVVIAGHTVSRRIYP